MVLEIKELDYELQPLNLFDPPQEFIQLSPLKKIPAYTDDLTEVCDSSNICQYLEDRYPETPLYPDDVAERAKARWFEEYADTKMVEVIGGPLFFERVVKPNFLQQETDHERVQKNIEENIPPVFDYLESQSPEQGYLVGDALSIADISICSVIQNARIAQYEVDAERWPRLASYTSRILTEPAFVNRLKTEQAG